MTFVRIEITDGIALATLDAPETRNAISGPDHFAAVVSACNTVGQDRAVKVMILTGAGSAFCAGGDVKKMYERSVDPNGIAANERYRYKEGIHLAARALYELEVPVIAAVNGPAVGAGLDFACMCDMRLASTRARFAESFVKLGIVPGDGGAWLLRQAVGPARAAEMMFTGDPISAEEALAMGLVSRVMEPDALIPEAFRLARRVAANPVHALRMAKRLLRESAHSRFETILEMSAAYQAIAHYTPEHRQRIAGIVNKEASS